MNSTLSRARITGASTNPCCADCSDPDVAWISLNRCVYICTECCSIHRSLGRHVSQVRPLRSFKSGGRLNLPQVISNCLSIIKFHTLYTYLHAALLSKLFTKMNIY